MEGMLIACNTASPCEELQETRKLRKLDYAEIGIKSHLEAWEQVHVNGHQSGIDVENFVWKTFAVKIPKHIEMNWNASNHLSWLTHRLKERA